MRLRRGWGPITPVVLAVLGAFAFLSNQLGEGFAIPVGIIGAISVAVILRGPVGKALARKLEGDPPSIAAPGEEVLVELDDLRSRVLELEERVDFSERLLASHRDRSREAGGSA